MQETLLYISELTPGLSVSAVAKIAQAARVRNAAAGITGLLTFDGRTFIQLLQGPAPEIDTLTEKLAEDPRHENMTVLYRKNNDPRTYFPTWRLGFMELNAERCSSDSLRSHRGEAALEVFLKDLPTGDAHVAVALPNLT